MRYNVRHVTRFAYDAPISESVMEVRMQPRSDGLQRCLHFALATAPQARGMMYKDHDGNTVPHFDIPARHARMTLTAEALVECWPAGPLPHAFDDNAWVDLDEQTVPGECAEYLAESTFVRFTPKLTALASELELGRRR